MLNEYRIQCRVAVLVCLDMSKVNLEGAVFMFGCMDACHHVRWVDGLGSGRCLKVNVCGKKMGW